MRRYLALQAMESGKPLASGLLGRGGTFAYGSGMLLNAESSSSKVGAWSSFTLPLFFKD
jgi:hypothetical protein